MQPWYLISVIDGSILPQGDVEKQLDKLNIKGLVKKVNKKGKHEKGKKEKEKEQRKINYVLCRY